MQAENLFSKLAMCICLCVCVCVFVHRVPLCASPERSGPTGQEWTGGRVMPPARNTAGAATDMRIDGGDGEPAVEHGREAALARLGAARGKVEEPGGRRHERVGRRQPDWSAPTVTTTAASSPARP